MVSLSWILPSLFVIILFFLGLKRYLQKCQKYSNNRFKKYIFWQSIYLRVAAVFILYIIFYQVTGTPFEPNYADSASYHRIGMGLANYFENSNFDIPKYLNYIGYSDYGFYTLIGILYTIFGPYTIVIRLLNVLLGSWTVVLVYQITRTLYNETVARLAGVLMMLFPYFLFYTGVHLKETVMIFLMIYAIYQIIKIVHSKAYSKKVLFSLFVSILLLFFFRNFLAVIVLSSCFIYIFLSKSKYKYQKIINLTVGVFIIISIVASVYFIGISEETERQINQSSTQMVTELKTVSKQGVSFKNIYVIPMLFIAALPAPFPSFVKTVGQENIVMQFSLAFIKNILIFFAIPGIFLSLKHNFRKFSIILFPLFGYLFVIAMSALTTTHRYQLPALPFLVIFISLGFHEGFKKYKNSWLIYLHFMVLMIIAWNYFKLSIRGLL
jgi:4-amino-4-deoxy-L-arabinose transferase-like glycosyltransferase